MTEQNKLSNAIRFLSVDAIQKANSGHPGMPLGMADIATTLWREFLNHNPNNSNWSNRDRFVLSNGHGSMLLYSLLHLTGYDLSIEDIKNFRQLHSKTPGHPEFGLIPGVETTTGPLGQGLANAVGMALAEKNLAQYFNKPDLNIVDHYTYVFVGDGCLMEGISHEVCSFAGTQGLSKLMVFWDDNSITIDGRTDGWFTEDVAKRFDAYDWHVVSGVDGHNPESIRNAIKEAQAESDKPTLICCKTIIGFGSPNKNDNSSVHGSPLGDEEIAIMRGHLDWKHDPFVIPEDIYVAWDAKKQGAEKENSWQEIFNIYQKQFPELAAEFLRRINGEFPEQWQDEAEKYIQKTIIDAESIATRKASQNTINAFCPILPELLGGSADLTGSNLTKYSSSSVITKKCASGGYIHYGVREFGMFAIMNGLSLHGGFIPFGGTFLVFASYGHSAIRMAAMMKRRVIYILSHDSIGLGEDGPTHQPVEQLAMLRATPNLSVWRPCDATEIAIAWKYAIDRKDGPTALVLTRQKVAAEQHSVEKILDMKRGAYILIDTQGDPDCILIATGSEVGLASQVATKLNEKGQKIRVISMPSQDVFDDQDDAYKDKVLPPSIVKRVAIEAACSQSWHKYVGFSGKIISLDRYGESAPAKILFEFFGFSEENVIKVIGGCKVSDTLL